MDDVVERAFRRAVAASHRVRPDRVVELVEPVAASFGARSLAVCVVDVEQSTLVHIGGDGATLGSYDVDGTLAGRAFISSRTVEAPVGDAIRMWVPLLDGAERVGVIGMDLAVVDDLTRDRAGHLAGLTTNLLIAKGKYTDAFARAVRTRPMSLSAELQWQMLPPLTFNGERIAIAGVVVPAYDIGGDAFDCAVTGDEAVFAIVDAAGHGRPAVLPATLALTALRQSRRRRLDPARTYAAVDEVLLDEYGGRTFVTAQIGRLDLETGELEWVSAGHPPPLLLRAGKVVGPLECRASPPLGVGYPVTEVGRTVLEPGDRLLYYTDGVIEGHRPGGGSDQFGLDRLADLFRREMLAHHTAAEAMRRLAREVLAHRHHHLSDDFTLVLLAYEGHGPRPNAPAAAYGVIEL